MIFEVTVFHLVEYYSFNAAAIAFKSRFTYYFGATIINLALVGFLCNLGVQYIIRDFLSIQMISRLTFVF